MKYSRIVALVASGVLAAAVVAGIAPLAAADEPPGPYTYLCNYNENGNEAIVCAYGNTKSTAVAMTQENSTSTNWYYPSTDANGVGEEGVIQQAHTTLCLQVDADAGGIVIEAQCSYASYQEWRPIYKYFPFGESQIQFQSQWNTAECLTYDETSASGGILKIGGCGDDWYQGFYSF